MSSIKYNFSGLVYDFYSLLLVGPFIPVNVLMCTVVLGPFYVLFIISMWIWFLALHSHAYTVSLYLVNHCICIFGNGSLCLFLSGNFSARKFSFYLKPVQMQYTGNLCWELSECATILLCTGNFKFI